MTTFTLHTGDCLDIMPAIPDGSVDMILCDLPYGVTARNKWDEIIPFDELWPQYARMLKENGAIVLTATQPFASHVVTSSPSGWFKYEWIWRKSKKTGFLNAKKQPLRNHEQVLVFYRSQPTYNPHGVTECLISCDRGGMKESARTTDPQTRDIRKLKRAIRVPS
jgi:site-specific DNA-methyltransferase (adenine-specific)